MDWNHMQPVEGYPHLYRDKRNGAIINTDISEFEKARKRISVAKEKILKEKQLEDKVNKLETDVSEIKDLLYKLLEKN